MELDRTAMSGQQEPVAPVPPAGRPATRRPGRRTLVALVLVLGLGAFLTVQSVGAQRSAKRGQDLARVAILTSQAVGSLNVEVARTMLFTADRTLVAPKRAMLDSRQQTDLVYRDLEAALAGLPGGRRSSDVESRRTELIDAVARLPFLRLGVDRGSGNMVIQAGYTKQIQATLGLIDALARDLARGASDPQTVDAASTLSALAAATGAASQETVRLAAALQEARLSDQTEFGLIELKVAQDAQLTIADSHATDEQRRKIAALRLGDDRIQKFRASALMLARSGAVAGEVPTGDDLARALTEARTFEAAASERLRSLDELVVDVAITVRDKADADARNALLRTGWTAFLTLFGLLLVSALDTGMTRALAAPLRRRHDGR